MFTCANGTPINTPPSMTPTAVQGAQLQSLRNVRIIFNNQGYASNKPRNYANTKTLPTDRPFDRGKM